MASVLPTPGPSSLGSGTRIALLTGATSVLACVACYLAALPWLRAYQVSAAPWLLAVCAFVPLLISGALTRALRFHALVSLGASITGLVLTLWVASDFDFSRAWDGAVHVPAQLLTETLPLAGPAYVFVAPMVLTWACAFFCAEVLLRATMPPSLPLAGPPAYFVLSFAATTAAPAGPSAQQAALVLGALAAMALARQGLVEMLRARPAQTHVAPAGVADHSWNAVGWHTSASEDRAGNQSASPRHTSLRHAAAGALGCGLVAGGLGLGLPHIGSLSARPVAISRPAQTLTGTIVDPVDVMAAMRTARMWSRPVPIFTVTVSGTWDGYIPMAVMSTYDGGSWSFAPVFRPTGGRVPALAPLAGHLVRQSFFLRHALPLPLLPALERPIEVTGAAVDADGASGMLAAAAAVPGSYQVTSKVPGYTAAQLPGATVLADSADLPGDEGKELTELPPGAQRFLVPAVRYAVDLTGQPATPTFSFVQDLASSLRADEKWAVPGRRRGTSLPAALTGTSLAQVMNAVTVDRAATPEQFATFVAVVGRYLGVPVRLVSGFRAPGAQGVGPLPAGRYTLTAAEAWAWDEVPVVGHGWVPLDPTPQTMTTNVSAPPEQVQPAKPQKPRPATAVPAQPATHAVARAVRLGATGQEHVDWALALGVGLPVAILVALAVLLLGIPAVRRRLRRLARERSDEPALLAAGAWLELLDNLARLGLEVPSSATSHEVAEKVSLRFGEQFAPPVAAVGGLADQAIYCSRYPVAPSEAQTAWESQRSLWRAVRSHQGYGARARSLLRVGPSPAKPLCARQPVRQAPPGVVEVAR